MIGKSGMTPLTKGGTRTVHAGKGSNTAPMGDRHSILSGAGDLPGPMMNNYAKQPAPSAPAPNGIGSGNWPGIGI